MKSIRNSVQLIGNVGTEPEVIVLNNGKKLAKIRLATTERYRNSEGKMMKETQWHTIVAWGNLATIIERYLNKGREIAAREPYEGREESHLHSVSQCLSIGSQGS